MLSSPLSTLSLLVIILFVIIHCREAKEFVPTNSSYAQFLRIMHISENGGYMLVGSRGGFFNVTLSNMTAILQYDWQPTEKETTDCNGKPVFRDDCNAFVRTALIRSENMLRVCASSAKVPSCRDLVYNDNTQEWSLLITETSDISPTFAPVFPWQESLLHETDEGFLYSATSYFINFEYIHIFIRIEPTLSGDVSENRVRQNQGSIFINQDPRNKVNPHFIGMFDTEDSVYLAFTEPTFETTLFDRQVVSRLARVCKNDVHDPAEFKTYQTFFKANLLCGAPKMKPNGRDGSDEEGNYGGFLNSIGGMTQPIKTGNGDLLVFGTFYSNALPFSGSAVCAYNMTDVNHLFETSLQLNISSDENYDVSIHSIPSTSSDRPPGKCVNGTTHRNGTQPFLASPVTPIGLYPLITVSDKLYRFTKIAVDTVTTLSSAISRTVFIGTSNGLLLKYADVGDRGYRLIEERDGFGGMEIKDLRWAKVDGVKHLLVNTLSAIWQVRLEKCHRHKSCQDCVITMDPYCAWDGEQCIAVSSSNSGILIQNLAYGVDERCHKPTTTTESTTITDVTFYEEVQATSGRSTQPVDSDLVTLYILVTLLPIALGVLGGVIGYKLAVHLSAGRSCTTTDSLASTIVKLDTLTLESDPKPMDYENVGRVQTEVINADGTLRAKKSYV